MSARLITHGDRKNLNIPILLLKDNKNSKVGMELLVLSVAIKLRYSDSRMPNVSATAIQKLLTCGFKKAKLLLSEAKQFDKLFDYNPKTNSLLAKNFTRQYYNLSTSKRGHTEYDCICYKLEIMDYSAKKLRNKFKQILVKYSIWAKKVKEDKKDALNFKYTKRYIDKNSFIRTSELSQYSLAKAAGMKNRKAVNRMVKAMERQGILKVERTPIQFTGFYAYNKEEMDKKFDKRTMIILPQDGAVCYKYNNTYELKDEEMNRFKHVIFNHEMRLHSRYVKQVKEPIENTYSDIPKRKLSIEEYFAMIDAHDAPTRKFS